MKNNGFTLIELMVTVTIVGILAIALGFSYRDWMQKYKTEKVIKDMQSDVLEARTLAYQKNRAYFVDFNLPPPPAGQGRYRIAQDTGNVWDSSVIYGAIDAVPGKTILPTFPKSVDYAITTNLPGLVIMRRDGTTLVESQPLGGTVCIFTDFNGDGMSDSDPDYDCMVIAPTRISVGKLTAQGVCNANNCARK